MFLVKNMFLVKDTQKTQYWRGFAGCWPACTITKTACTITKTACTITKTACTITKTACTITNRPALSPTGLHYHQPAFAKKPPEGGSFKVWLRWQAVRRFCCAPSTQHHLLRRLRSCYCL